jgi:hypothetical protein
MASSIQLLSELEEAQLRRLEPRLYHLVLTGRPCARSAAELERAVEADAAPEPYAVLVEPLAGATSLSAPRALLLPRACHVSVVARSPLAVGLARVWTLLSHLSGGPPIVCYESLEAAFAAAQRAIVRRSLA